MTNEQPPEWRKISKIQYALSNLRPAFPLPGEFENAISNAIRSGEAPVRGRKTNNCGFFAEGSFERLETRLNPDATIDILGNKITLRESYGKRYSLSLIKERLTADCGTFLEVEADVRAVERWLRENALPADLEGEKSKNRRGAKPRYDWGKIRRDAVKIHKEHGGQFGELTWYPELLANELLGNYAKTDKMTPDRSTFLNRMKTWEELK